MPPEAYARLEKLKLGTDQLIQLGTGYGRVKDGRTCYWTNWGRTDGRTDYIGTLGTDGRTDGRYIETGDGRTDGRTILLYGDGRTDRTDGRTIKLSMIWPHIRLIFLKKTGPGRLKNLLRRPREPPRPQSWSKVGQL